jgi:hypothetical protein
MGEMRNSYKIFVGKIEGKRPLGRYGSGWKEPATCPYPEPDKYIPQRPALFP